MKKFLPLVIFIMVFAAVLAGQVGFNAFSKNDNGIKQNDETIKLESVFLKSEFKTIDNQKVVVSKIDSPVVIVNFWASWCIPCLEEMPSMMKLKQKFSEKDLKIIAINTDEEEQIKNINKTLKKIQLKNEFIIVPDQSNKFVDLFNINAIPVTLIFRNGKLVHQSNGQMDFMAEELIEKMKVWIKS